MKMPMRDAERPYNYTRSKKRLLHEHLPLWNEKLRLRRNHKPRATEAVVMVEATTKAAVEALLKLLSSVESSLKVLGTRGTANRDDP